MKRTLKGIGMSLGIFTSLEAVTAQHVDVRLERKKAVLETYHKALPAKGCSPRNEDIIKRQLKEFVWGSVEETLKCDRVSQPGDPPHPRGGHFPGRQLCPMLVCARLRHMTGIQRSNRKYINGGCL